MDLNCRNWVCLKEPEYIRVKTWTDYWSTETNIIHFHPDLVEAKCYNIVSKLQGWDFCLLFKAVSTSNEHLLGTLLPHEVLGKFQRTRTEQMVHYFRRMKEVTPFSQAPQGNTGQWTWCQFWDNCKKIMCMKELTLSSRHDDINYTCQYSFGHKNGGKNNFYLSLPKMQHILSHLLQQKGIRRAFLSRSCNDLFLPSRLFIIVIKDLEEKNKNK